MSTPMFAEDDVRIERIWCDERSGTMLRVEHVPTGIVVERLIGFEDESRHRRELLSELSRKFAAQFPPGDFLIENLNCGSRGAGLRIQHIPTGISVGRFVGYEPQGHHRRELFVELFQLIRKENEQDRV